MHALLADLRYAIRRARSRSGFTLIAIVSLGLGIGVNTAAFSLVNAIVLRKTPLPQPERVVQLYLGRGDAVTGPMSYPDYVDLREQTRDVFGAISLSKLTVTPRDMGDHVETIMGELVNGDYFPMLGLRAQMGRLLGATDDVADGAHPVVVLSDNYWRGAFGGDPGVVGKDMRLGGRAYTIVGVAPRSIEGLVPGLAPAFYASMRMLNQLEPGIGNALERRGDHGHFAKARLADGQTMAAARTAVARYVADMRARYPDNWSAHDDLLVIPENSVTVNPLMDKAIVPAATALMVVVALVLIVACANLASFLLAQARDREREIAIRLAIGAGRRALVRQLLVESLLLSLAGGALGIALSALSLRLLLTAQLPVPLPINLDVGLDARILGFATLASVLAAVLFGLVPAIQATRPNVVETIKNENAGAKSGGGRRFTMRSALVVAQTATSLVLLVTAALFLRSFAAQSRIDPGFGAAPTGLAWIGIPSDRFPGQRRQLLIDEIERRMRELPDADAVGVIDNLMLNALNQQGRGITVDGFEPPKGERSFGVDYAVADSGFFDAAGIRLIAGRNFSATDNMSTPRVAIINENMAREFWPKGNAVGSMFRQDTTMTRVIGVASNTKVRSLGEPPRPMYFGAAGQAEIPTVMIVARTRGDAAALTARMVSTLHDIDPSVMIVQAKTMERHLAAMVLPARLGAVAFAVFAGLALVLAMIGIYGVVRYAVTRREREVAIRLAVGAAPQSVVRLLMRDGVMLVGAGAILGLALAALMARGLEAILYGVHSTDPLAFVAAPLVLVSVGVVAAFLPARRASRVDPASTLRRA
ncbi:MAG TPA: ADOP family duplicated permease [Gemmatimonadaceae bacterium]|nr:ADOP family duplicated permease [Gemmatimonadaceae bacterium]